LLGGVLSVLHPRLLEDPPASPIDLAGSLMSMIVLPFLVPAAARRELARPAAPWTAAILRLASVYL
jgi:hypothetical protein